MKHWLHSYAVAGVLASVAILSVSPASAGAGRPVPGMAVDIRAFAPAGGPATFGSWSFETGEGFSVGSIEGQGGFATDPVVAFDWATIASANPSAGSQHMRLLYDPLGAQGDGHRIYSPIVLLPPNTLSEVTQQVFISNDLGADYFFVGQSPSQGYITWFLVLDYQRDIYVLDTPTGSPVFVDTGADWTPAAFKELAVQLDPAQGEIRYYYDKALIYTSNIYGGTTVEQLVWIHDNYQLTAPEPPVEPQAGGITEVCDIDQVNWIDEFTQNLSASWGRVKAVYR
jgi:hypothetical protein